jgi:hypothetical protein
MHLPAPEAARHRVEATRPAAVETVPVHLLADSLHTALVFDLKWLEESGYAKPSEIGDPRYVAMSWGEGRLIRCPENYSYYFPRICNVWTVQALQSCGFQINTSTALSANGLVRQATPEKNSFRKIWDPDDKVDP